MSLYDLIQDIAAPRAEPDYEWQELATYNSERARGIQHTPEWQARMSAEQARFNARVHPPVDSG